MFSTRLREFLPGKSPLRSLTPPIKNLSTKCVRSLKSGHGRDYYRAVKKSFEKNFHFNLCRCSRKGPREFLPGKSPLGSLNLPIKNLSTKCVRSLRSGHGRDYYRTVKKSFEKIFHFNLCRCSRLGPENFYQEKVHLGP